jgi:putative spermidine/putrescine transport system permease protein
MTPSTAPTPTLPPCGTLISLITPAVATGALFAFATSFDELIVALFIASPDQFTLPRQMYAGIREFLSPTIAAAAVLIILLSVVLLMINETIRKRAIRHTLPPTDRTP